MKLRVRKNGQQKTYNLFCKIAAKCVEYSDIARFTTHVQTPFNNLIYCKTGFMWVVKRATSVFNSFCSNVAKQVARFLLPVFLYL